MFPVKKAKSRNNFIDYIEVDLKQVLDFLLTTEAPIVESDKKLERHSHQFPLSDRTTLILSKTLTKGRKTLKHISVKLEHGTWQAGIKYNENLEFLGGYNYNSFDIAYGWEKSNKNILFIALDGGFNLSKNRHPYFLSDYQFNYVYERIEEE